MSIYFAFHKIVPMGSNIHKYWESMDLKILYSDQPTQ